jgi:Skp family chaperone for outer membrane proteins
MVLRNLYLQRIAAVIILLLPFIIQCSSVPFGKSSPSTVIRYVNIKAVYDHVLKIDSELIEKSKKRETLLDKKKSLAASAGSSKNKEEVEAEIKLIDDELSFLAINEDEVKLRIYKKISTAVRDIARRRKIDMVLNMGDSLIYAKKEFDITEDIIDEIKHSEDQADPQWK